MTSNSCGLRLSPGRLPQSNAVHGRLSVKMNTALRLKRLPLSGNPSLDRKYARQITNRLGSSDTLRLVFAVLVIFSHSFALGRGSDATEPLNLLTHGRVSFGEVSVWSFFCISGFLITQSWTRAPFLLKFLRRRVGRIYPGFIVAALFGALIVAPLAADQPTWCAVSPLDFLLQTARLHVFHCFAFARNAYPNALNGSLWSIPFEFWCYVGVMAAGVLGVFRRRWLVVIFLAMTMAWRFFLYLKLAGFPQVEYSF
jgi:peptidoglycan/LPS O-acetylase OafA/YrhL